MSPSSSSLQTAMLPCCRNGLMPHIWRTGGMYTIIYTTAWLPPAQMYNISTSGSSQINLELHLGTLRVPSSVKPLSRSRANSGWAETPPKPGHVFLSSLCASAFWRSHDIWGIKLLNMCFDTNQQVKPCFPSKEDELTKKQYIHGQLA